jgi:hypothetical protein
MDDKERREKYRAADPEMYRGAQDERFYTQAEVDKLEAEGEAKLYAIELAAMGKTPLTDDDDLRWSVAYLDVVALHKRVIERREYIDFLEYLRDYQCMPRQEFCNTHGSDIADSLDKLRLEEYLSGVKDFIDQVSHTGRLVINSGTSEQYIYDFHGSPWIEKDYIPKGLYAQKIAQLKKILSDSEGL